MDKGVTTPIGACIQEITGRSGGWTSLSQSAGRIIGLLLASFGVLLAFAASASALSVGVQFRNYDPGEVAIAKRAGATVYRLHVDYRLTSGANVNGGWGEFETIVKAAWERGITVLPVLERSVLNSSGEAEYRFLTSGEEAAWSAWRSWAKAAVERFGINGKFWEGKASPTPITAWKSGTRRTSRQTIRCSANLSASAPAAPSMRAPTPAFSHRTTGGS